MVEDEDPPGGRFTEQEIAVLRMQMAEQVDAAARERARRGGGLHPRIEEARKLVSRRDET